MPRCHAADRGLCWGGVGGGGEGMGSAGAGAFCREAISMEQQQQQQLPRSTGGWLAREEVATGLVLVGAAQLMASCQEHAAAFTSFTQHPLTQHTLLAAAHATAAVAEGRGRADPHSTQAAARWACPWSQCQQ